MMTSLSVTSVTSVIPYLYPYAYARAPAGFANGEVGDSAYQMTCECGCAITDITAITDGARGQHSAGKWAQRHAPTVSHVRVRVIPPRGGAP